MNLAPFKRFAEDVRVSPVVVAELELGNIKRQVFMTDFVECADHAALNQRPETLNGLCMDSTDNVLPARMIDSGVWKFFVEKSVGRELVGTKQADLCRDGPLTCGDVYELVDLVLSASPAEEGR